MSAILISILLGLTAAAANVFGGAIIVQRHWERRYLRYFVALGAGFMLATALGERVPESLEFAGAVRPSLFCLVTSSFTSSNTRLHLTSISAKRRITTSSSIRIRDTRYC